MEYTYEQKRMYATVTEMANWLTDNGYFLTETDITNGKVEFLMPEKEIGFSYLIRLFVGLDYKWNRAAFVFHYWEFDGVATLYDLEAAFTALMEKIEKKTHYYVFAENVKIECVMDETIENKSYAEKKGNFRKAWEKERENDGNERGKDKNDNKPVSVFDAFAEEVKSVKKKN